MAREEIRNPAPVQPPTRPLALELTLEQIRELAKTDPDKALKLLELREKLEQREKSDEQARRLSQEQRQKFEAIEKQIQATYAAQAECLHRKENGQPAIVGLRDSVNSTHYLCLRCEKAWVDNELPHHLRTGLREIGGPSYS
jgi:hypothetical protein